MYGVSTSTYSRTKKVGRGSKEQDLTGEDMMIRRTSSFGTGRNAGSDTGAVLVMTGGGVAETGLQSTAPAGGCRAKNVR